MKDSLRNVKLTLVYIYEYFVDGHKQSAVLLPIDAANGVILEEIPDQPGIMQGLSVSGGMVHIPIEGITNHFQSWWKLFGEDGRGGRQTVYTDDETVVGKQAARDVGKANCWDENGEYTKAKPVDRPSPEARRIVHKDKRPEQYRD